MWDSLLMKCWLLLMYGLYIDDVKGICSPITDTMCVKYTKKILLLFWAWKAGLLQRPSGLKIPEGI
jgi:hypothetical protein